MVNWISGFKKNLLLGGLNGSLLDYGTVRYGIIGHMDYHTGTVPIMISLTDYRYLEIIAFFCPATPCRVATLLFAHLAPAIPEKN